jgi:hypothetical protein
MRQWQLHLAAGILCILVSAGAAQACSVCQGDPADPLVKGAQSGVLFMAGLTYFVVLGMIAVPIVWTIRARRLRRKLDLDAENGPDRSDS